MAKKVEITPVKTYATKENAIKAFENKFGAANVRYFVTRAEDGRWFPVAIFGHNGEAIHAGIHFHFNVIG